MRPITLPLLAFLGIAATAAYAESGDAADQFLNAFLAFEKGKKAEATGNTRGAISSYNQAINVLDQIHNRWPNWSPTIITFRREKAVEAISRLSGATGVAGTPGNQRPPAPTPFEEPPLPADGANPLPPDSLPVPPEPSRTASKRPGGGDPLKQIQDQLEGLQRDLKATRDRLDKATVEKEELAKKYEKAIRDAKESAERIEVVQKRADRAEAALGDAEKSGDRSADELAALRKAVADARRAVRQSQIERDAEAELNAQFAAMAGANRAKSKQLAHERDTAKTESAAVPKKIADMQKEIDKVVHEKGDLETKLTKVQEQLTKVSTERDDALAQLTRMKEAAKNVDKLLAENTQLMAKLQDAEKQISTFKAEGAEKDKRIAALTKDLDGARTQLAEVQKQSADYQGQMAELRKQLEVQAKELTQVKADATASLADRKKLSEENDILRGIVLRQQKEQANRDRVKKLVLEQMAKLEINSKALKEQVELLGSPVVKLTDREKRLFKEPQLSISDTEITFGAPDAPAEPKVAINSPQATPIPDSKVKPGATPEPKKTAATATPAPAATPDPKKTGATNTAPEASPVVELAPPAAPELDLPTQPASLSLSNPSTEPASLALDAPLPDALPNLTGNDKKTDKRIDLANIPKSKPPLEGDLPKKDTPDQTTGVPDVKTGLQPAVPPDLVGMARDAKEQFERGNYREAEKIYEKALAKAPSNLYVLSNLGVVRFRQQKYKLAIEAFNKAVAIAPEDDFSHCTMGIVRYQMGEFDNAIQALTRALAINPKNATAHNYLGITASQKGWQEAAQKELETATELDPNYADAHFNLAVVFGTQSPANKEEARKHYKRAIELGAEPDTSLEQLIK
jgi:Tfp pilus assembly protein PilF/septal ring factor EnvC (AmiA/AmiB activator)